MSESNNKNEKLLNTLQEKITNLNMKYDIDQEEEDHNPNNNNNSSKSEENKDEDILDFQKDKKIIPKNNILKESLTLEINHNNYRMDNDHVKKLSSIKLVKCKIHNKKYLKIDENSFEIVCEKCLAEGKETQLLIENEQDIDSEENNFNCYKHIRSKGSFFCEECKKFVCKMCFAEEHRMHKCHLPEIIKKEFEENLQQSIEYSKELNPILNDNINDIKKIYNDLKKQKDDMSKIPQNILKIISNDNDIQTNLLMEKTIGQFNGIDNEVHDNYISFHLLKDKTKKYLEILHKITEKINENDNFRNNFDLCEYHQEQSNFLKEIFNHINSSNNFINIRLNSTNHKYDENKEKIENSLNLMSKEIINYEKSCISSILTGRENRSIVLRRYIHFSHNEIKYFKNSIIGFASNNNVFICGLSLCGLYLKKKKQKAKETNNNNNTDLQNNNDNNNTNNETDNENTKKTLPIQITVSTMSNQVEGEKLFVQKCELTYVKGSEEASIIINFEKGIKIIKEKLYLMKVENLSDNNYIDIWTGSVGKLKKKNIQVIRCHNTGIQFLFKHAEGIQTDFDEFDNGIIEGILYSVNK